MASDLGMHCLSMSHEKDALRIWVKQQQNLGEDAVESCGLRCEYVLVCVGFLCLFCGVVITQYTQNVKTTTQ